jgi:hypothetical protein
LRIRGLAGILRAPEGNGTDSKFAVHTSGDRIGSFNLDIAEEVGSLLFLRTCLQLLDNVFGPSRANVIRDDEPVEIPRELLAVLRARADDPIGLKGVVQMHKVENVITPRAVIGESE